MEMKRKLIMRGWMDLVRTDGNGGEEVIENRIYVGGGYDL